MSLTLEGHMFVVYTQAHNKFLSFIVNQQVFLSRIKLEVDYCIIDFNNLPFK